MSIECFLMWKTLVLNHLLNLFLYYKDNYTLLIIRKIQLLCRLEAGEELSLLREYIGQECCRLVPEHREWYGIGSKGYTIFLSHNLFILVIFFSFNGYFQPFLHFLRNNFLN